jgi:hypothetical protein
MVYQYFHGYANFHEALSLAYAANWSLIHGTEQV